MRADHHEARQWIEDKADVHADVLAVEATLKASRKGETMHVKQLGVVNRKLEDVMASQHLERKGTKLLNKTVEKLKSTNSNLNSVVQSKRQLGQTRGPYNLKAIPIASPLNPNPKKREQSWEGRKLLASSKKMAIAIGEDADPSVVGRALDMLNLVKPLQGTAPFCAERIEQDQQLVDKLNGSWNAAFAVKLKQTHLISDRDMDEYRFGFSHDMIDGKPRPRLLSSNPFNERQRVMYPEPITSRHHWSKIIASQEERFGLIRSEEGDCTERSFPVVLQALVDRDAHQLDDPDAYASGTKKLKAVIGFDGADDFCHVLLGLVEYMEGVACESEIKRVALAIMMGDDHNPSLQNIFASRLGPDIESFIKGEATIELFGRPTLVEITTCLDLSASCSMTARRCNASPHTLTIDPHLVIECRECDTMDDLEAKYLNKMPWLDVDAVSDAHHPDAYPWKCRRQGCTYAVANEDKQVENMLQHAALVADKSKAGKAKLARTVKGHCEQHDQTKEFECVIFPSLHPRNNIVDYLHSLDLQLAQRLSKFSWMDPVVLADRPELRDQISAVLLFIDCALDIRVKEVRDNTRKWFHGAVWHYDFVMGANKRSFGLDGNMLLLCLVCFGVEWALRWRSR